MEWMIVALCLMIIVACTVNAWRNSRETEENAPKREFKKERPRCPKDNKTAQEQRERKREAYYMRNFLDYDGSEQREWDEEA